MEKFSGIEGETTTYNREAVQMMAMEEALDRLDGALLLPSEEKIKAIQDLINELGATEEGTDIPLHNEHRHVVEQLSLLLSTEIAQKEFNALMQRLQVKA